MQATTIAKEPIDAADLLEARGRNGADNPTMHARTSLLQSHDCQTPLRVCSLFVHWFLQEDDEFEEFENQEWTAASEDVADPDMWQDGWEDDEDAADLTAMLRAELKATEGSAPPPQGGMAPPPTATGIEQ